MYIKKTTAKNDKLRKNQDNINSK